jgi:hypothetical protein
LPSVPRQAKVAVLSALLERVPVLPQEWGNGEISASSGGAEVA